MPSAISPQSIKYSGKYSSKQLALLVALVLCLAAIIPAQGQAQAPACAQDVIVQMGDTLSTIATRTLGAPGAYTRIVEATNARAAVDGSYARIDNPAVIQIGWKLCVPGESGVQPSSPLTPSAAPTATPSATAGEIGSGGGLAVSVEITTTDAVTTPSPLDLRRTPDGPHPLTLAYLREQSFPGSEITIEQTLAPGSNYNRYLVSYLSEGLRINAYMTVPFGEKPPTGWPVVIFNHGYIPPAIYRPTERYIAYTDAFARAGYILLRPDYRGHADSEGESTSAYGDPAYTIDVINALASIKQYPDADPNRIGMWGHSMGGYITARAMVVRDDIKAGVIWAGVVGTYEDLMENWTRRNPIPTTIPRRSRRWRDDLIKEFGTPDANPAFWASISTNSYVGDLSGPVQLHHGTNDGDVPLLFSERFYADVIAADGYAEFYTYAGDDHNIATNFNTAMQRSVEFMDRFVKNGEVVGQPSADGGG